MKTIEVIQFNFNKGQTRKVEIPTESNELNDILNEVFHYGQNDFQPQNSPSVSVGDVILFNDERHVVKGFGFEKLTDELFNTMKECSDEATDKTFSTTYKGLLYEKLGDKGFDLFF